jgi:hypothetical protein
MLEASFVRGTSPEEEISQDLAQHTAMSLLTNHPEITFW